MDVDGNLTITGGTLDAVAFLHEKVAAEVRGKVFTMIEVLKGA